MFPYIFPCSTSRNGPINCDMSHYSLWGPGGLDYCDSGWWDDSHSQSRHWIYECDRLKKDWPNSICICRLVVVYGLFCNVYFIQISYSREQFCCQLDECRREKKALFRHAVFYIILTASEHVVFTSPWALWSLFHKGCDTSLSPSDQVIFPYHFGRRVPWAWFYQSYFFPPC